MYRKFFATVLAHGLGERLYVKGACLTRLKIKLQEVRRWPRRVHEWGGDCSSPRFVGRTAFYGDEQSPPLLALCLNAPSEVA